MLFALSIRILYAPVEPSAQVERHNLDLDWVQSSLAPSYRGLGEIIFNDSMPLLLTVTMLLRSLIYRDIPISYHVCNRWIHRDGPCPYRDGVHWVGRRAHIYTAPLYSQQD